MITTVTGKNQITIPAELAREAGIETGARIDWSLGDNGELIGKPLPSRAVLAEKLRGVAKPHMKPGESLVDDLLRARRQEARNELARSK